MFFPIMLFSMAAAGLHAPTAETEGLSVDAPASFVVANQDHDDRLNLVELVKPPETVDDWSQLISVTTLMHASEGATLSQIYPLWRDDYRNSCPGKDETVVRGTVDGKPALKASLYCPRDPKTGKPESLTVIFVQGEVNLLSVQLSFRRTMTTDDRALILKVQKSMKVCDSRERAACDVRRATGFLRNG